MIPKISLEVCETIVHEVLKDNTVFANVGTDQEFLQWQWAFAYTEIVEAFGAGAGEAALRLAMLTYKAIEAQMEVLELEKNFNS